MSSRSLTLPVCSSFLIINLFKNLLCYKTSTELRKWLCVVTLSYVFNDQSDRLEQTMAETTCYAFNPLTASHILWNDDMIHLITVWPFDYRSHVLMGLWSGPSINTLLQLQTRTKRYVRTDKSYPKEDILLPSWSLRRGPLGLQRSLCSPRRRRGPIWLLVHCCNLHLFFFLNYNQDSLIFH